MSSSQSIDIFNLPQVDLLSPVDQIGNQLKESLGTVGFAYVTNHGYDKEIKNAFEQIEMFFHMPIEQKLCACSVNRALRGFSGLKTENFATLAGIRAPNDSVEKFRIGPLIKETNERPRSQRPFYFPNTWPHSFNLKSNDMHCHSDVDDLNMQSSVSLNNEQFQTSIEKLYQSMTSLADEIASALAIALNLHPTYFKSHMLHPTSILSANYYPVSNRNKNHNDEKNFDDDKIDYDENQTNIAPHTDVSLFTIVIQQNNSGIDTTKSHFVNQQSIDTNHHIIEHHHQHHDHVIGGLEVNIDNQWKQIPSLHSKSNNGGDCNIIINIGDCLMDWTNGELKSTIHRVTPIRRFSEQSQQFIEEERMSFAFFCTPDPDTNVHPTALMNNTTIGQLIESNIESNIVSNIVSNENLCKKNDTMKMQAQAEVQETEETFSLTYNQWRKQRVNRAMATLKKTI